MQIRYSHRALTAPTVQTVKILDIEFVSWRMVSARTLRLL